MNSKETEKLLKNLEFWLIMFFASIYAVLLFISYIGGKLIKAALFLGL